ncbi:hypothetical protein CSQ85_09265 [Bifidobacterium rousetti]|uniref:hypothetical protein n=1 Tax=Bifidobacterium rousetti TaxID=2045439 RepID=UPI001239F39E|nr:hypothetical protein [Bifidobacterium rousetti]KAA8818340.1 hypothetical protein CSQ85_09265 [Bifidobacterium rousetti]
MSGLVSHEHPAAGPMPVDVSGSYARYRVRGDLVFMGVMASLDLAVAVLFTGMVSWWLTVLVDVLLTVGGFIMRLVDRQRNPTVAWLLKDVWGLKGVAASDPVRDGETRVRWMDGYLMRAGLLDVHGTMATLRRADGVPVNPIAHRQASETDGDAS